MRFEASALTQPIKPYLCIPGLGLAGLMLSGYALIGAAAEINVSSSTGANRLCTIA
jgi:hypothetical protein